MYVSKIYFVKDKIRERFFLLFEMIEVITNYLVSNWKCKMLLRFPLYHMYVNVTVDLLEVDKTAQVNLISLQQYLE